MRTKILFSGDYRNEFGGDKPRIWRTFAVYLKNKDIGRIEQEPEDYKYPFKAYNTPCVIGGNYIGQFKTRMEAIKAINLQS